MLKNLIKDVAKEAGITQAKARLALGVIFNAAERQGSPMAEAVYTKMPGVRTLAAKTGAENGAASGVIARLIEQTPGGRRYVAANMIRDLHGIDLGHKEIGKLLPSIAKYLEGTYEMTGFGHLGDIIGTDMDADADIAVAA
ncbi:MAG: hypothetical protein V3V03_00740 [Hyphomonadaceae bacterium]